MKNQVWTRYDDEKSNRETRTNRNQRKIIEGRRHNRMLKESRMNQRREHDDIRTVDEQFGTQENSKKHTHK